MVFSLSRPWLVTLSDYIHQAYGAEHQLVRLFDTAKAYRVYAAAGRRVGETVRKPVTKRKILGELSSNIVLYGKLAGRRKKRLPRPR